MIGGQIEGICWTKVRVFHVQEVFIQMLISISVVLLCRTNHGCFHFLLGQMDDSGESNVHTYKHHIKVYRGGHL